MKRQVRTMVGVMLVLATVAEAQTQKGNGIVSGTIGASYRRSAIDVNGVHQLSDYTLIPQLNLTVGKFANGNWLLGLSVNGNALVVEQEIQRSSGQSINYRVQNRTASVVVTPFVRRYWQFAPVQVFAGAGLSAGISNGRQRGNSSSGQFTPYETVTNELQISPRLEAGINYFLSNRLALQLTASAGSLPFTVGSFETGLVYWTGGDRKSATQPARDNRQTNRGNWVIEGSFSTYRSTNRMETALAQDRSGRNQYNISPSVGRLIGKNVLLGLSIPLTFGNAAGTFSNPSATNNYESKYWSIGLSPYFQQYWTSTRLTPYTRVSATYLALMQQPGYRIATLAGAINLGLAYMVGQRFIVETSLVNAALSYRLPTELPQDARTWDANLSAGLTGRFAVRYVLTRAR